MALRYGYFDSDIIGVDDEGMPIFDRAETSDFFAMIFDRLLTDGVLAQPSDNFRVVAAGNGLNVDVQPGFGMVRGRFAWNDEVQTLTLETAPKNYSRIDLVVLRANYLQRMVEIVVKTGEEAANPTPPTLIRPNAGDYFELCLARIKLVAGQTTVTQSSITDTRPDSAVCGYITQFIDTIDTSVFFEQFNAFYTEFVERSNLTYEQFRALAQSQYDAFVSEINSFINTMKQNSTDAYNDYISRMTTFFNDLTDQGQQIYDRTIADLLSFYADIKQQGQDKYDAFNADITAYIAELKSKGNTDLAAITQQMLDFRNTNEAAFTAWFETIKGQLGDDAAGHLQNEIDEIDVSVADLYEMLYAGAVRALMNTSDGDYITDDRGTPLLVGWSICKCNNN